MKLVDILPIQRQFNKIDGCYAKIPEAQLVNLLEPEFSLCHEHWSLFLQEFNHDERQNL